MRLPPGHPLKVMSRDLLDMLTVVADDWRAQNPRSARRRNGNRKPRPRTRARYF